MSTNYNILPLLTIIHLIMYVNQELIIIIGVLALRVLFKVMDRTNVLSSHLGSCSL